MRVPAYTIARHRAVFKKKTSPQPVQKEDTMLLRVQISCFICVYYTYSEFCVSYYNDIVNK